MNFTVTYTTGISVGLQWQRGSGNAISYELSRCNGCTGNNGNYVYVATISALTRAMHIGYQDQNLTEGQNYRYKLRERSPAGQSSGAYVNAQLTPKAPTNLHVAAHSSTALRLTWLDNSNIETDFEIQRRASCTSGAWSTVGIVSANQTSYLDYNLISNRCYVYRVRARMGGIASPWSAWVTGNTTCAAPLVPGNFVATVNSSSRIQFNWTHNGQNLIGFDIQRRVGCTGSWYSIFPLAGSLVSANARSYTYHNAFPNTCYEFRIKGCQW